MLYGRGGTWQQKWERLKIMGGQVSHNKPIGCGASGAYALGPDDEEEEEIIMQHYWSVEYFQSVTKDGRMFYSVDAVSRPCIPNLVHACVD